MTRKEFVKNHELTEKFLEAADRHMAELGYTEHGKRHATVVSENAEKILKELDYPENYQELAWISGYLHDIGNLISRETHGSTSAILAKDILDDLNFSEDEIAIVMQAIGNHEEEIGDPTHPVSAALIIGDKSDVHRSRVRNPDEIKFDIHDRVNYAVIESDLKVEKSTRDISLILKIDEEISSPFEYFEIFLSRMLICRRSANVLKGRFHIFINDVRML